MLAATLTAVQHDWFGTLSGGQQAKAEIVRSLLLKDERACPAVLLLDEVLAALDPASKHAVLQVQSAHMGGCILAHLHADARAQSHVNAQP